MIVMVVIGVGEDDDVGQSLLVRKTDLEFFLETNVGGLGDDGDDEDACEG